MNSKVTQKPISTRLHRFTLALDHARRILNLPKIKHLEKLVSEERREVALFVREENE